jgi:hypothetical protein
LGIQFQIQKGKNDPQKRKKVNGFHLLKYKSVFFGQHMPGSGFPQSLHPNPAPEESVVTSSVREVL